MGVLLGGLVGLGLYWVLVLGVQREFLQLQFVGGFELELHQAVVRVQRRGRN
jgi:hypothetical protein